MVDSILKSILESKVADLTKEKFIDTVSKSSGISKNKLTEVYAHAISKNTTNSPVAFAKSKVYSYVKSKTITEATETFDRYEDLVDALADEYTRAEEWFDKELDSGGTPPDGYLPDAQLDDAIYYYADEIAKFGVTDKNLIRDVHRVLKGENPKFSKDLDYVIPESDEQEERYYRIWDGKENRWVSKHSTQRTRLRNKVDKLDNEYGAYRYQLVRVDAEGNKLN